MSLRHPPPRFILAEFIIGITLVIATGAFLWSATAQIIDAHNWVAHTFDVLTVLTRLERQTRDVEMIERLPASSERQVAFAPFAVESMTKDKDLLLQLTADNAEQQERLKAITALLTTPRTTSTFPDIRAIIYGMHDTEAQLLNRRTLRVGNTYGLALWFLLVGKTLAIISLTLCFVQHTAEIARRRAAEAVLQSANQSLSEQVKAMKATG